MAFFEQRFPVRISRGATGGPIWNTQVVRSPSGYRSSDGRALYALHGYELSHAIDSAEKFKLLRNFFYVVGGRRDGFRFQAPDDHTCAATEGVATLVSGDTYQLCKDYVAFSRSYRRPIYKPVSGKVTVYRTRSGVTTDITGATTVDTTTGRITVAGHMSGDTYTWAGEFDIPVAFEDDRAVFRLLGSPQGFTNWPSIRVEEYRIRLA